MLINNSDFSKRLSILAREHEALVSRTNISEYPGNGIFERWQNRYVLMLRVEGNDRKSWFGIAESASGVDNFKFWQRPVSLPETSEPDINVYDMRLTAHEDGLRSVASVNAVNKLIARNEQFSREP